MKSHKTGKPREIGPVPCRQAAVIMWCKSTFGESAGHVVHDGTQESVEKKKGFEKNIMRIFLPHKIEEVMMIFYKTLRNKTQGLFGWVDIVRWMYGVCATKGEAKGPKWASEQCPSLRMHSML